MSDKFFKSLLYIGIAMLFALAFASIVSIFSATAYNWDIACKAFWTIILVGVSNAVIDRIINGCTRND